MGSGSVKRKVENELDRNWVKSVRREHDEPSYAFLETIDERKLDFDFEKRCSVTLSHLNCYCCLACGKYFQGRRENTPAFLHSVNESHHVFINFSSLKVYLLPDGVEVEDQGKIQALVRIRNAIRPRFSKEEVNRFPNDDCFDLANQKYTTGFVGLNNNSSGNDSINVILLLMSHIVSVRNYFLLEDTDREDEMVKRLAIIIRKLWSPKLFKSCVSSEEFLAYLSVADKGAIDETSDPRQLFMWLVNTLADTSPSLKRILNGAFRGTVEIMTIPVKAVTNPEGDFLEFQREYERQKVNIVSYWCLTLDLPPNPLFKDNRNANDLPQVRIEDLMKKFNGTQEQEVAQGLRKYRLVSLPQYLVLHFNRFNKKDSQPVKNRNQTLVEFSQTLELQNTTYILIANIVHDSVRNTAVGNDERSLWKIQMLNTANDQWVEFDGATTRAKERELLFLQETYIQVWEKHLS